MSGQLTRRDFARTGALVFGFAAGGGWSFDFAPDEDFGNEYRHTIPFRKTPREIREVVPGFLWADAADFQTYGGWALDTQHVGFMGSSYLLAHGTGKPVRDAKLILKDVLPGTYRLWVRCRNWIPVHAPGRFGMLVNGKPSRTMYGAQTESGWTWQDGGTHDLAGKTTLTLQDQTGMFGRCSSVILTRDLDYNPPVALDAFRKERARLSGVSDAIRPGKTYDVIVVGAGPAGGPAAIAAARLGAKTALVSNRPVLGGNASVEIGVPVQGAAKKHQGKPVRETGIIEEIGRVESADAAAKGQTRRHPSISRALQILTDAEPLLDVYDNQWLEGANTNDSRIAEVILRDALTGGRQSLSGKMFIDCTGDAWLGYHAGADERVGREARSEYNEEDAPEKADGITMSGCLRGASRDSTANFFYRTSVSEKPQPFTPPPWIYPFPDEWENGRGSRNALLAIAKRGTWWLEHPGDVDDLRDPEFARDELIRVSYSFWHHMKNTWSGRERLAKFSLDYLPFMVGKREGRRLMGDYVMNANDALEARTFEDVIGHTGWSLDVHHPAGILSTEGPNGPNRKIPIGQIPYRCLYSRNVPNLLMAGRCASVTHEALGTVRIEASCAVTGQAAGTAAVLALHRRTTPRGIYRKHLKELQQLLLRNDQFVPGVPNEDPADLARGATVTASSAREPAARNKGRWFELGPARGEVFRWTAGEHLQSVHLYLKAKTRQEVVLHLREATNAEDLSAKVDAAKLSVELSAGTDGWIEIPVSTTITAPYAFVFLESNPAVQWQSGKERPGGHRFYGRDENWTPVPQANMSLRLDPEPNEAEPYKEIAFAPANVTNGIARPWIDETANMWESDPAEALPQWIELRLREPAEIGMIQCVFDTDLTVSMPTQRGNPFPKECVRDYTIECNVGGAWKRVAEVRGNFLRLRQHAFEQVQTDRIRLKVEATHGAKTARIIEIRAYADGTPLPT